MPWGLTTMSGTAATRISDINLIVDTGELKSDFSTLAGAALSQIIMVGGTDSLTVCYQPKSKSFRSDNNTKFDSAGVAPLSGCPSGTSSSCYWCVN